MKFTATLIGASVEEDGSVDITFQFGANNMATSANVPFGSDNDTIIAAIKESIKGFGPTFGVTINDSDIMVII